MRWLDSAVEVITNGGILHHHVIRNVEDLLDALIFQCLCSVKEPAEDLYALPGAFACVHEANLVLVIGNPEAEWERDPVPWPCAFPPRTDRNEGLHHTLRVTPSETGIVGSNRLLIPLDEPGKGDSHVAAALAEVFGGRFQIESDHDVSWRCLTTCA
jgi:hypothetical protein